MILILLLLFLGDPANSLALQGSVKDTNQSPVADAMVYLQQETASTVISVHTDTLGHYRFTGLAPGPYRLRAESTGFSPKVSPLFSLNTGKPATLDLTLEPIAAAPSYFDEPKFTVAGVTDNTYRGGHGADTVLRSSETLAKATASLAVNSSSRSQTDESAEKALKAQATETSNVAARLRVGGLLLDEGKCTEAIPYLQQASVLDPRSAEAFDLLGSANEGVGNALEAVRAYQKAVELQPTEKNVFDLGAELLTHAAADAAIETFDKGAKLYPKSARMIIGWAVALYSRGLYNEAATRFFEACDVNPSDPQPYIFLGKVQRAEITNSTGFLNRMERFTRLQPNDPWANYYYAVALWKKNNGVWEGDSLARIKQLLSDATRQKPDFASAYLQLGIIELEEKDLDAAFAALQRAAVLDPHLEETHYRLAQVYKIEGEPSLAERELRSYSQISKQNAREIERDRSEMQRFVITLRNQHQ